MTVGSEEASTTATEKVDSGASAAQTPGAMLEHERSRRGLSIRQAAEGLHLDSWIIEAIEANRFLALGAPVYAKGYLRKYATLLGLAPEVIIARYDALTDTLPEPTPVPVITTTPPPRPKWPKCVAWALLAALLIAIGVAAFEFLWPAVSSMRSTVTAPPPEPVNDEGAQPTAIASSPELAPASAAPEPAAQVASPPAARAPAVEASTSSAAQTGDLVRLTLAFSDASWVEVYDAAGQRLFYNIGQAGRTRTVAGTPPLNVVIGVAAAVQVRVNDREIIVPRQANRDSTRFAVHADGSVE